MIEIKLQKSERFDHSTQSFVYEEETVLQLEHSLRAVAEWESKWKKPFLSSRKTGEEFVDYIRCMSEATVEENDLMRLTENDLQRIESYINDPMTATKFSDKKGGARKIITNEEIYYLMAKYGIPFECDRWHLSRLLTLIHVCAAKNAGPKKMSLSESVSLQTRLNEQRRKRTGSKG